LVFSAIGTHAGKTGRPVIESLQVRAGGFPIDPEFTAKRLATCKLESRTPHPVESGASSSDGTRII